MMNEEALNRIVTLLRGRTFTSTQAQQLMTALAPCVSTDAASIARVLPKKEAPLTNKDIGDALEAVRLAYVNLARQNTMLQLKAEPADGGKSLVAASRRIEELKSEVRALKWKQEQAIQELIRTLRA